MTALIDSYGMPPDSLLDRYDGACRYLSHNTGKCATAAQVHHIVHVRKQLWVSNFEDENDNAKGGRAQGSKDAEFALAKSHEIGQPTGTAIYYSVDYQATAGELPTILDYFRGIRAEHAGTGMLVGAYGDVLVLEALFAAKLIDLGWQTSSWSNGVRDKDAAMVQTIYTPGYDVDQVEHPFIGAWTPTGPQPNPSEDEVSAADVITALKSAEGQELLQQAVKAALNDGHPVIAGFLDGDRKPHYVETGLAGVPGYQTVAAREAAKPKAGA